MNVSNGCPKCGDLNVKVKYIPACRCGKNNCHAEHNAEHLDVVCERCGYEGRETIHDPKIYLSIYMA